MNCIKAILEIIDVGCIFDSHYVINRGIKEFSDEYIRFVSKHADSNEPTLTAHQMIGHEIAKFEGILVERQKGQSWSENIHGNGSTCALWKRI